MACLAEAIRKSDFLNSFSFFFLGKSRFWDIIATDINFHAQNIPRKRIKSRLAIFIPVTNAPIK